MPLTTTILIDSRDRDSGTSASFVVTLPTTLQRVNRVTLKMARIPMGIYNITTFNQDIDFDEGAGTLTATIPEGSYTATSLANAVKLALDAAGTLTYTVTVDSDTMKMTIADSAGATTTVLEWATGPSAATSIGRTLGFDTTADTPDTVSHTGDFILDINQPEFIHIRVTEFENPIQITSGDRVSFPLAVNKITTNHELVEHYDYELATPTIAIANKAITTLTVSLITNYNSLYPGYTVSLNGLEWQMELELGYI